MKSIFKTLAASGFALMATTQAQAISQACIDAGDNCVKFTVLHTNDHHGRFWQNAHGELGMAARKTLIESIRTEVRSAGGEVLLFSGGDINTGTPESDLQDAKPDFIGMNHLGYDAMAVGNHEFDNPLEILNQQRNWAKFPMLAANIYHYVDGKKQRYFEPYKVFEVGGLTIAVIGLTTDDTPYIGNPEYLYGLEFAPTQTEIKRVLADLNKHVNPQVVFALTHMGHYANGKHGSNAPGDVKMARALAPGQLDAIFGGHSQNPVCMEPRGKRYADFKPGDDCTPDRQNGTWIMQAFEWGKYLGRADFEYYDDQLHMSDFKLIPVNLKLKDSHGQHYFATAEIVEDQDTLALLRPFKQRGEAALNQRIGTTDGLLNGERAIVRRQQTALGVLIAEAQRQAAKYADFGIMPSGGIRDSIEAGPIRYRDVLSVHPFGNTITHTTMKGSDLTRYLNVVATQSVGSGGFSHFSGIDMDVNCETKSVSIYEINGREFHPEHNYRFTISGFHAAGGNGFPRLKNSVNTDLIDADILMDYIKAIGKIKVEAYQPNGEVRYNHSLTPHGCDA